MDRDSAKQVRRLIETNGPPLSPMLIFTLLDALEASWDALDSWKDCCEVEQDHADELAARIARVRALANTFTKNNVLRETILAALEPLPSSGQL